MTMLYLALAFFAVLHFVRKKAKRKRAAQGQPEFSSAKPAESDNDCRSDGAFRRKFGVGPHCNGFKCNPEEQCNIYERRFCQAVICKWNPNRGRDWAGQYCVRQPKKWRRVDFAVAVKPAEKGAPATALAIEFDGFESHAQLGREKFQDQLDRHNNLYMSGWGTLRFSYQDLMERPDHCVNTINSAVNSQNTACTARLSLPPLFADVGDPVNPESEAAKRLWSSGRKKHYIPVSNKKVLELFNGHTLWAPCPDAACVGRAVRNEKSEKHYWACDKCGKIYFDNGDLPPEKECIPYSERRTV